jgi:hypothetical protein
MWRALEQLLSPIEHNEVSGKEAVPLLSFFSFVLLLL